MRFFMWARAALWFGVVSLWAAASWAAPSDSSVAVGATGERLQDYCRRLAAFDFNGSVLVAQHGQIILRDAFGWSDPRNRTPNTVNTVFSTGSVTKQFTAAAILDLEAKKKLSVNDTISRYLGTVPDDKRKITIHQLLTHSSGLPASLGADFESISRDSLVALAMAAPLLFEPGTGYEYSNVGYSLAAAIVEKVSKKSYEDYLKGMWQKAGLKRTGLYSLAVPDSEVAHSHNATLGYPSPATVPAKAWHLTGNGGVLTTPSDLYRWYSWLQTDKAISPAARSEMFTPHVTEGEMGSQYGYGWVIQDSKRRGGQVIWHNGGAMPAGWSCALYDYMKDSLIVIVCANKPMQGHQAMDPVAMGLVRLVFDSALVMPPKVSDTMKVDEAALAGNYVVSDSERFMISVVENRLRLSPRGQAATTALFPSPSEADPNVLNLQTAALVSAASKGDFEKAGAQMDMPPGKSGAEFVQGWWNQLSELGTFQKLEVYGTRMGDGAQTHARLEFTGGSKEICFYWQEKHCMGIGPSRDFYIEMAPQTRDAFASYNIATGDVAVMECAGKRVLIDTGTSTLKATKE